MIIAFYCCHSGTLDWYITVVIPFVTHIYYTEKHKVYYNTGHLFYEVLLPDGLLPEPTDLILAVQLR